jgi:hypothetical protein
MNNQSLQKLQQLQSEIDSIRKLLGVNSPGAILYQSRNSDDSLIVVEADGFGGATTFVVEGNYPLDYVTQLERFFQSEQEAEDLAEKLASTELAI